MPPRDGPSRARTTGVVSERPSVFDSDAAFDRYLPKNLRVHAAMHFTPVEIARDAARLLAARPGMRVLDIGSGPGKFCVAAAAAVPTCEFVGVEWRPHLVDVANRLARDLAIPNVRFICADALALDWSGFEAFYLFNPFAESLWDATFKLDSTIDHEEDDFASYVAGVRQRLALAPVGTRVVTYHGYGAPPPLGYEMSVSEPGRSPLLELWVKTRAVFDESIANEFEP